MLSILLWLLFFEGSHSLKLVELNVPEGVARGAPVWMYCGYNLEGDELYSVKWYKNNVEFYRFLPSDKPPGQKYDLLGVHINLQKSNKTHVYLQKTELQSGGSYGCEVSTEAPSYHTVKAEKVLKIYDIPEEKPVIEGAKQAYQIGDEVNVTCFSLSSKPIASLQWIINGKTATSNYLTYYPEEYTVDGLGSTALGLTFIVNYGHFQYDMMTLGCKATVTQNYSTFSEEIVIGENVEAETLRSPDVLVHTGGPKISGENNRYGVGDILELNCTSVPLKKPQRLAWYINGVQADPVHVVHYLPYQNSNGDIQSTAGLRFQIRQTHFHTEGLRLSCSATISKVIGERLTEIVIGGFQHSPSLQVSVGSEDSSRCSSVTPWITMYLLILMFFV
ncbi:uncharacterized protein LOC106478908 [Limulus polyphemus]|uniref:Uncharacterized protein LOC106478908 n=1 Tax=Limulus polyphemus TaxID=6850 RepID=A0ABM1S3W7_LIMPO|nr:uncharacterized protein LOC106478908 [Limulus polyphemus]